MLVLRFLLHCTVSIHSSAFGVLNGELTSIPSPQASGTLALPRSMRHAKSAGVARKPPAVPRQPNADAVLPSLGSTNPRVQLHRQRLMLQIAREAQSAVVWEEVDRSKRRAARREW